ncbi:uncharacterized protein LOC143186689 [Calliopsis andreniformis]|uniref:uncharacterized protein LOC143186689 n=1 Tax=Calliopsis andreniformis TaxID=337506 RepID=UPI003FCC6FF4
MDASKQTNSYEENKRFLLRLYRSKEHFKKEYKRVYYDNIRVKELYLVLLTELKKSILNDNIDNFKKLGASFDYINSIENESTLKDYYDSTDNPIKTTNLIILTCKQNNVKMLRHLFDNNNKILCNLSINSQNTILPHDKDETCHNVFYYAIRSGNVELLDMLINKWPNNYFALHLNELDEILSKAYKELKLKHVPLSEEIETFVENELINLHFFSNTSGQNENMKHDINNIIERIELVLENINTLSTEYSNIKKVDQKFLFVITFIAQNINILKKQLKSTYNKLPWEEIEFCLITFITSQIKCQEINLFYCATLNKEKILNYLKNFAKKLEDETNIIQNMNVNKLVHLPQLKRDEVIAEIINNYPEFKELYIDYQQIRDVYSLEKIADSIQLALSTDVKEKEGHLVITRILQIMGEYLKNSLESPKLSSAINELLLLSLPKNTKKMIADLRNSLSHAYSLSKRTEIVENMDVKFFTGIQNDIKKIGNVITDILYDKKIKTIQILLKKIVDSENFNEIREIVEIFHSAKLNEQAITNFKTMECMASLMSLYMSISCLIKVDQNVVKGIKFFANKVLENIVSNTESRNIIRGKEICNSKILRNIFAKTESSNIQEIAELSTKIFLSIKSRTSHTNLNEIQLLVCRIFIIAEFNSKSVNWIKTLKQKLNENDSFVPTYKENKSQYFTRETQDNELELKL